MRAALALQLRDSGALAFRAQELFLSRPAQGLPDFTVRVAAGIAGWLEIEADGATKRIGITRVHMEEDAAKNLHEGFADSDRWSYIDYNRCGMPLIEIVSEPDMRTPAEAYAYLTTLKQMLRVHGSERLQHGRRLAALRCQRQRAACAARRNSAPRSK